MERPEYDAADEPRKWHFPLSPAIKLSALLLNKKEEECKSSPKTYYK